MEVTAELKGWPGRASAYAQARVRMQQAVLSGAQDLGSRLVALARQESPRAAQHQGGPVFAESWEDEVTASYGGATVTLRNTDPKAALVMNPTRAHDIWANHSIGLGRVTSGPRPLGGVGQGLGFLRFSVGGNLLFRHMVHHPGTPGNDVLGGVAASADISEAGSVIAQRMGDELVASLSGG